MSPVWAASPRFTDSSEAQDLPRLNQFVEMFSFPSVMVCLPKELPSAASHKKRTPSSAALLRSAVTHSARSRA